MIRWRAAAAGFGTAAVVLLGCVVGVAPVGAATRPAGTAAASSTTSRASVGNAMGSPGATVTPVAVAAVTPAKDHAIIALTAVEPLVVGPGADVTIRGTVTAPSVGALLGARLRVVLGTGTLDRRAAVDDWATGTGPAAGRTVVTHSLPTIPAGGSRAFTVRLPAQQVGSSASYAVIPVALEVTGRGAARPVGQTRTFLTWQSRKEFVPLDIATILPVTLDPDLALFARDEETRGEAWVRAVGPGSRVGHLIDSSAGHEVTLAVDPSLFGPGGATATPPATGSAVPPSTGSATPPSAETSAPSGPAGTGPTPTESTPVSPSEVPGGTATNPSGGPSTSPPASPPADQTITRLADGLATQLRGRTVWALPYADADVAAAAAADPTNAVVRDLVSRSSIITRRLDQPVRSDVVLPADGLLPVTRENRIAELFRGTTVRKPAALVVNSDAITSPAAYTPSARRVTASGTRLLAYDPALSALLPTRTDKAILDRQRFLAQTLALLGELPGTERSVLLLGSRTYDPDPAALAGLLDAIDAAPWLHPVPADSLLVDSGQDAATPVQSPRRSIPSAAPRATLTGNRLVGIAQQRDTLHRVATVLRDGTAFEDTYRELLDELASVRWRWAPAAWTRLESSVAADIRDATKAIHVIPRSFNFLAEQGTLTLTVENGLDFAIDDIRLVLAPTTPRLQVVAQPGPITIGAGSKTSVKVTVRAVAAGRADVRAYLTTSDGTPIGQAAMIPIQANPLDATIYGIGGAVVGLILLIGVIRTIVRGTSRIDEIEDPEALAAIADNGDGT